MFAYCGNSPVIRVDYSGHAWDVVLDIISLGVSIYDVISNPDDPWAWGALVVDAACLVVPFVSGGGAAIKAATKVDDVVDVARAANTVDNVADVGRTLNTTGNALDTVSDAGKVGWKVGDDIANLTKAGKEPSWTTVRQRYWKNQAVDNAMGFEADNIARMKKGLAPIIDGSPMELHHPFGRKGNNFYVFEPLSKATHHFIHYGW